MRPLVSLLVLLMLNAVAAADWESEADARIEQHRKGDFTVDAPPGSRVTATLARHDFPFGTAFAAKLLDELPDDHPYKVHGRELFNRGTLENYLKWYAQHDGDPRNVERRRQASDAVDWMIDNGMTVHAHVVLWATLKYGVPMPESVEAIVTKENPTPQEVDYVRRAVLDHARDVVGRYRGRVTEWDVVNEHWTEHAVSDVTNPVDPQRDPLIIELFKVVRETDPDARLFVNDFGILQGHKPWHKNGYERFIRFLQENDAPVGGIGMQAHIYNADLRLEPGQIYGTIDRFAGLGLPVQITEFDTYGRGWGETREEREAAQAGYLRVMYKTAFSHPAVNGITMWGFWDGRHWTDNAPLFREDWSKKPGYDAYVDLLFDEWHTIAEGTADAAGTFAFRGFYGTYDVTIDGQSVGRATFTRDAN